MPHMLLGQGETSQLFLTMTVRNQGLGKLTSFCPLNYSTGRGAQKPHDGMVLRGILHWSLRGSAASEPACKPVNRSIRI